MMKKLQLASISFAAAFLVAGAEPLDFPEKADWQDSPNLKTRDGDVLEFSKGVMTSTEIIKIEPGKTTILSGEFRSVPGQKVRLFFAFSPHDAQKRVISALAVNVILGSDTELAAPVKKGDITLKVKDASKFRPGTKVIFNTKEDLSDLPNRECSHGNIKSAEKQPDGTWLITLTLKLAKDYPAGTKVRAHASGGYQYAVIADINGDTWQLFSGKVKGMAKTGMGGKVWAPGSAYAKVVIFSNGKAPIQFRNVKMEVKD